MRILLVGAVATLLGVGGGSLVAGSRLKDDIVKRLEEESSLSRTTAQTRDTRDDESGGRAADPATVQASVDLSANLPGAEEDTTDRGQEPGQPAAEQDTASGGQEFGQPAVEEGGQQEPRRPPPGGASRELLPSTATLDLASELTVRSDSGTGGGERIDPEASRQLAKIFAAMRPEDAAAVLQGMEDPEVQAILLRMGDRQAAAILGDFAPDRAASLTRLVLLHPINGS